MYFSERFGIFSALDMKFKISCYNKLKIIQFKSRIFKTMSINLATSYRRHQLTLKIKKHYAEKSSN